METLAWPSHSCTLAISASSESAFVAAVSRCKCTHSPFTSALMPVSRPYLRRISLVYRTRIKVLVELAGPIVGNWPEQRFVQAFVLLPPAVFPHFQILPNEA